MFRNYLIAAWRSANRDRLHTIINVLGLAIGRGNILGASRALTAFLGYILGVVIASSRLKHDVGPPRWSREVEHVVLFEAGFLLAFAALWFAMGGPSTTVTLYTLILIAAIAMGLANLMTGSTGREGASLLAYTSGPKVAFRPVAICCAICLARSRASFAALAWSPS